MRLWTLHPKYLDRRGLVALWREGLLAQAVLRGRTEGYTGHPQLVRFHRSRTPAGCIAEYLRAVCEEGMRRGYAFDAGRIGRGGHCERLAVTRGQLDREWGHLLAKVERREPGWLGWLRRVRRVQPHPLFHVLPGGVEDWEKGPAGPRNRGGSSA